MPFEAALDEIAAAGATAVEIRSGGLPGSHHCPVGELLTSAEKRSAYRRLVESRGLIISTLSCHWDPLSPDAAIARDSDRVSRKSVELAQLLEVPVVNVLSGLPAGADGKSLLNQNPAAVIMM